VQFDACFEGHQAQQIDVADLEAGHDQQDEPQCVQPVPEAHRQGVEVDLFVLTPVV
jgi:hypothetical protein